MHNSLRESFNSHRSKALLTLAILATTSGALFSDLKAQTSNNGANPKMEQVDKNDAKIVADFTKPLGVTIPAKWIKFASDNIQMLDQDGIDVAHQLILADFAKIPQEDRLAYVLMAFDAIHKAYDHEEHITAGDAFLDQYLNYEKLLIALTKNFGTIWTERAETYIAQNKQEIAQNKQEIAQNKQEIAQNKQEIAQKNKLAENNLIKLYETDPTNPKVKNIAKELRDFFKDTNYSRNDKTEKIFIALNIK